jgi:hypothetical protein
VQLDWNNAVFVHARPDGEPHTADTYADSRGGKRGSEAAQRLQSQLHGRSMVSLPTPSVSPK